MGMQHAIHAEADMLGADQLDHMVDMLDQMLDHGPPRPHEAAHAGDADHPAGGGAGLDLVVPDIALMVPELAGIGMAEDDRRRRGLDGLHGGLVGAMGAIDHHADAVHLGDDLAPEFGEADVLVMATAAGEVVAVVGEEHLAHAEPVIEVDHADIAVERVHAFEIEGDRKLALAPGAEDVLHRLDLDQGFRVGADPVAKLRHAFQRLGPGHDVIAGVDREIVDAGGAPALQTP